MMLRVFAFLVFTCRLFPLLSAAKADTTGFAAFAVAERQLIPIAKNFINARSDAQRRQAANTVYERLGKLLAEPNSWNYPFDSLRLSTVSVLSAPDRNCRFFTWNLILKNGDHKYYGYVQYRQRKEWLLSSLLDTLRQQPKDLLDSEFDPERWPGALYYQIQPFRSKRQQYYLLLGYDGGTARYNRKVMDVVRFDPIAGPVFGAPLFRRNPKDYEPQYRWVVDCADQAVITFRFEPDPGIVVLSELHRAFEDSPDEASFRVPSGDYHYFAQDKKGYWVFYPLLADFSFGKAKRSGRRGSAPD